MILDTSVVSEPLRAAPHPRVVAWLDDQAVETLYLTTISLAELRYGLAALPAGRRRRTVQDRFETEFLPLFAGRILAFDEPASGAYAAVRADCRRQGFALGDFDALIAGIATSHGFAVATRDTAPFLAAQVSVIDPFVDPGPIRP